MSIYLEGTLPWLFDPDSPELGELAREADTALFGELLRDRHFGVATGRFPLPEVTGGRPLGFWNATAWRRALHGPDGVPPGFLDTFDLPAGDLPWAGRMLVLVDRRTRSSGESSAWLLRQGLGARLLGEPTFGMIEYVNIVQYALPRSRLVVSLPTTPS